MSEREIKFAVPSFPTVEGAADALRKKDNFEPSDLYPRDGTKELAALEGRVASLVGVPPDNLYLYNTGMTAVVEAIESSFPTSGWVLAHGRELYSQSGKYINDQLRPRGIRPVAFDSSSIGEARRVLSLYKPQIIFAETVANGPDMSVLELDRFFSLEELKRTKPLVILDNTLPTPSVLNLAELIKELDFKVLVVESGTKFYGLNSEMVGMIYSFDQELLKTLRQRRRTTGSLLSLSAVKTVASVLPSSKEEFDVRNRTVVVNTFRLAQAFNIAGQRSGKFAVSYPNLPSHNNYKYASRFFPEGLSPVFFILCNGIDQFELTRKLWRSELLREYCDLGQSFGFERTRIWPDNQFPVVRIAGGTESSETVEVISQEVLRIFPKF